MTERFITERHTKAKLAVNFKTLNNLTTSEMTGPLHVAVLRKVEELIKKEKKR
ncbi:MAG: hypothetical protein QXV69_00840 [Sulfolobaceae archaeon]